MGELVGQGLTVGAAGTDDDVAAGRVGTGSDLRGGPLSGDAGVQAHVGEVGAEPGLHVAPHRVVQRTPGRAQHVGDRRALRRGGLLVAAALTVGVPGLGE